MTRRQPHLGALACALLLTHLAACADPIAWLGTRADAAAAARNSGKLVLLLAGRRTCIHCTTMKTVVCEAPAVRQLIDSSYVCWYCPVDESDEWHPYATGLGTVYLPMICVIDPGDPTTYLDRSTSSQDTEVFRLRLLSHLPAAPIRPTIIGTDPSRLRWATEGQLHYRVLKSEDLVNWVFVGEKLVGDGAPLEVDDWSTAARCCYRVMGFR